MNTLREEASTLARALVASLSAESSPPPAPPSGSPSPAQPGSSPPSLAQRSGDFQGAAPLEPSESKSPAASAAMARNVEIVIAPPFPWLTDVAAILAGSQLKLAAQNMHADVGGAYTGEVSPRMLKGLCDYVLVGQYERRILFGDKEAIVRRKLQSAQEQGLKPILCVGEDADQLDEGLGLYVVAEQVEADLEGARIDDTLVIAYEPSWTTMGRVAPPPVSYVVDVVGHIRDTLTMLYSAEVAEHTRVIYGGQVNPRNIAEIAAQPGIDGVLSSTASTNAANFATLANAFRSR
jgi:triosephosphate isomerase